MKNEEEDKKWIEEYPTLKQVKPVDGFAVPSGYFDAMEEEVMAMIRLQQYNQANAGFTVPAGYFDELTAGVTSRAAIEGTTANAFKVPENYFEDLAGNIRSRITIEEALNTEKAFEVPADYFEELTGNIEARIAVEQALDIEEPFTVPEGYFADLESRILAQTTTTPAKQAGKEEKHGNVVKFFVSKAFKYASAACFALVVGAAVFMSEFNNPVAIHNRSYLHKEVSKIPVDELEIYAQLNSDNADIAAAEVDNTDGHAKAKK